VTRVETGGCEGRKHGIVDLVCGLPDGHEGWHEATYSHTQTVQYPGWVHRSTHTEHVSWEPDKLRGRLDKISRTAL